MRWPRFDVLRNLIGGERGKVGHVGWMTSWDGWGIGGEGEKVGHVGWGRGKRHFRSRPHKSPVKKTGSGSKKVKIFLFYYFILFGTKKENRGPGPSVRAGVLGFLK